MIVSPPTRVPLKIFMLASLLVLVAFLSVAACADNFVPNVHKRRRQGPIAARPEPLDKKLRRFIGIPEHLKDVIWELQHNDGAMTFDTVTALWCTSIISGPASEKILSPYFVGYMGRNNLLQARKLLGMAEPHMYMFTAEHFKMLHGIDSVLFESVAKEMLALNIKPVCDYMRRIDLIQFLASLLPRDHHLTTFDSMPLLLSAALTEDRAVFDACLVCCNPLPLYAYLDSIENQTASLWIKQAWVAELWQKYSQFFIQDEVRLGLHDTRVPIIKFLLALEGLEIDTERPMELDDFEIADQ